MASLSPNLLNISIVPRRVLFPERSVGPVWAKAHDCVDALHAVVRKVDLGCTEAEENPELSASSIARRRTELCEQALFQLANFRPFEIAEKAFSENIDLLEKLTNRDSQQVQMYRTLKQARGDLKGGIEATKRLLQERCKLRERVYV